MFQWFKDWRERRAKKIEATKAANKAEDLRQNYMRRTGRDSYRAGPIPKHRKPYG
jgi:hypothetical protein